MKADYRDTETGREYRVDDNDVVWMRCESGRWCEYSLDIHWFFANHDVEAAVSPWPLVGGSIALWTIACGLIWLAR